MMEKRPTIGLLTDFGSFDSYVAEIKAVILSINPDVNIIDITHNIEPQNILHAALMLKRSFQFFPLGTIFVCIVDPEVGSGRGIIYIKSQHYDFIAPDNGLLWMTANNLDVEKVVTLDNYEYFINKTPSTFEGRDKMAPVAAFASMNIEVTQFGALKSGIMKLELPETIIEKDLLLGEIIYFDNFGNAITNISFEKLMENQAANLPRVHFNGNEIGHISSTFADAKNGTPLAYFGSSGYLEIAVNNGSFKRLLNARPGDKVMINYAE